MAKKKTEQSHDSDMTSNNKVDINKLMMQMLLNGVDQHQTRSMNDSLEKHMTTLKDSYSNSVLGIGNADHIAQFSDYSFDNSTLNWFLWLALYNDSWVFRRVIDKPSQDMVRPGISISGNGDYSKVYHKLDELKPDIINAFKWCKLFGGSIMVLLFNGISFDKMQEPMNWDDVKNTTAIRAYVTDRWFGCSPSYDDIVTNLANYDFGKPKYYDVQFTDGTSHRIHHSWIIRFENRDAPQLVKSGQLQGWGYAEGSHLIHELERDEKLKTSIQSLIDKSLIEVIQMAGMRGIFMGADKGTEDQLRKRLEMVNWGRNFNSLTFLDKDDSYTQHQFGGLNGLSDLLQQNMWQIAAACEMQGILFGDLSNGFSTDDDALERYDEKILNDCETYYRKPMTKLLRILFHVYDVKDKDTGKIANISFTFNSIIASKKNVDKRDGLTSLVELCNQLVKANIITIEQEAKTLQEFNDTGSINFDFTDMNKKNLIEKEKYLGGAQESDDENDFGMGMGGDFNIGGNELEKAPMGGNAPTSMNEVSTNEGNAQMPETPEGASEEE